MYRPADPQYLLITLWSSWIHANWNVLSRRVRLPVPAHVGHPGAAGFKRLRDAFPVGQVADWSLPLSDGSRIHVHELPDGSFVAHRDAFDPERGASNVLRHLFLETPVPWIAGVGLAFYAGRKKA